MALSEKYIIENPENYATSTFFYSKLYGIDASNNVDKLDPWEQGIECLFRSDGRDRKIRENSKFSIKNLEVPMNVGEVNPQITKLLELLKSKQKYEMMKKPIEDFYKMMWIPLDVRSERHFDKFHQHPLIVTNKRAIAFDTQGKTFVKDYEQTNKLLSLNNIQPYNPLTLNLYRDVDTNGKLVKTKLTWSDLQQFDHTGSVMLNDNLMLKNSDVYWALTDPVEASMKELKFDIKKSKYSSKSFVVSNKDPRAGSANYSAFQMINSLFGSYMFLRNRRSGKILNHQSLSTSYKLTTDRDTDGVTKNWGYPENNNYLNMKKYCKSDFGNSTVANANGHVDYVSTNRSIFDMDYVAPSRWSERLLPENETDHFTAMSALGFPMMIYNRNIYGLDKFKYKVLRRWNINRDLEDYELLIPTLFSEEIEDSLTQYQQIYQPLEHRVHNKPNELKDIVDALKAYVLDFDNNKQILKTPTSNLKASVTSTVIDHTDINRAALKKLVDNISTDDLLELWGTVGCIFLNPFKVRTGPIIKETLTSKWAMAPFYSPYLLRYTRYICMASKGLIERYQLSLLPIQTNVDYSKLPSLTNNILIKKTQDSTRRTLINNFKPSHYSSAVSSTLSPLLYFGTPKEINILDKLKALGYPKNFLQIQETVVFSEDCQKVLYAIDQKRYNRVTIFTNEKIFLNSNNYKLELYSRAKINPSDYFKIITTNTSSIHLHFYRYDSSIIKQVFDASVVDKTPHPMKNVILSIHEPRTRTSTFKMSDFRFHSKITYIISPKPANDDLQTDFTSSISDEILQADLKAIQEGDNKGQLYIQLTNVMIPTSFKDKNISRLFILSDLAENTRFYIDNSLEPVLASINVSENTFIQRHMGQNGSTSIPLTENDKTNIAPIIPIDQIYKLNSFFIKVINEKSQVVEFSNDKFPLDLTLALYYKKKNLKRHRNVWQ